MISYNAPMLPKVNYQLIEKNFSFTLVDLEFNTIENCSNFLSELKHVLIEENLIQIPELMVAYLCAFLGTATTVHTVKNAEKLEPDIIALLKHQATDAFLHFYRYPINSTIKSRDEKISNLEKLRKNAPGSIVAQTMRLGREIMDILEELASKKRTLSKRGAPKQTELFCSQETLTKLMLLMSSSQCAEWRNMLDNFSDNYVPNQLAIQIGWLIGYFSHLDNKSPDETQYFDYGLPLISMYREHVYRLMETYAGAVHAQEASEAETLLEDIRELSEKTYTEKLPAISVFQKQMVKTHAAIEKVLITLLNEGSEVKIILMSLFYFWFTLEAPLCGMSRKEIDNSEVFPFMPPIIDLVKKTIQSLPAPPLSQKVKALNNSMQKLKKFLPHPEKLDNVAHEKALTQTPKVNAAIHAAIGDSMKKEMHIEVITNSLFSHWLRFSVFFGVPESEWQKMDFYLPELIKAVREYLTKAIS